MTLLGLDCLDGAKCVFKRERGSSVAAELPLRVGTKISSHVAI